MIHQLVQPQREPFIQPFHILPSMRSAEPSTLILLPALVLVGALLIAIARRSGFGDKVWTFLIVLSASLIGLSTFTPVAEYLWGGYTARPSLEWLPTRILQAATCTIPLIACLLLGLKGHRFLATAASTGIATFYLVYPVVYTYFQRDGFLVPGLLEVAAIATATLLFIEFSRQHARKTFPMVAIIISIAVVVATLAWVVESNFLVRVFFRSQTF